MSLTQSAISKSLKELESTMGTRLFERTSSGLRPTACCNLLERYARSVIHGFNLLCRELRAQEIEASVPILNTGASAGGPHALLMRLIQHPRVGALPIRVTVQMENSLQLMDRLMDGQLDIVIAHALPERTPSPVHGLALGHDTIMAVARPGHPVFHNGRAYHHHPWMLPAAGEPIRELIEQCVLSAGQQLPRALLECAISPPEPEAAIRDDLVVWTTRALADPWVLRGDLRYLTLPFPPPTLGYFAMRLRHHHQTLGGFTLWDELVRELRTKRRQSRQHAHARVASAAPAWAET